MKTTANWIKQDAFKYKLRIGANKFDTTHLKGSISCLQIFGKYLTAPEILFQKDCHWAGEERNSGPCPSGSYFYHDKCYEVSTYHCCRKVVKYF